MRSRNLATVGATVVVRATGTYAAPALAAPPLCPPGFNVGAQTFEQRVNEPKSQAAIAAGVVTFEQARAGFSRLDENGNGLLCVQNIVQRTMNAPEHTGWTYFDIVRDDLADVPSA